MAAGSGQVNDARGDAVVDHPAQDVLPLVVEPLEHLADVRVALGHRPGVDPDPPAGRPPGRTVEPQHPAQPLHRVVAAWPPSRAGAGRARRRARTPRRPGRPWCRSGRRPAPGSRRAPPRRRRPGSTARPSRSSRSTVVERISSRRTSTDARARLRCHARRPMNSARSGEAVTDVSHLAPPEDRELVRMLPAEAYTSDEVLAWERRHLYAGAGPVSAGSPTCSPSTGVETQRAVVVGDVACLRACETAATVRMFANTCRHRGHELLPPRAGGTSTRRSVMLPLPRVDLRPGRPAQGRTGLPRGRVVRAGRARAGRAAGAGLERLGLRPCPAPARQPRGAAVRAVRRRARAAARAVRHRRAGGRRPAHLRGRGELEGDRGELPRVLPLPADPPRAVPGHAARTPATTTTCRGRGSAAAWCCATGWRPCRWTARWPRRRCPASTRPRSSTCTCCPTCSSPRTPTT